ncbi:hypothetical protein [Rhizobium sp. BK456]|uniref:hypothetical protein n=1 Tax=Rhizobium sp. BK456 TaxID=2587007 RepID=UPI001617B3B4|nr:hypothetical protein [Rhizobium sp. BK456]MBB3520979.1 putative phage gp36 major capsid-like protein [Rhizobium sp. BK456]
MDYMTDEQKLQFLPRLEESYRGLTKMAADLRERLSAHEAEIKVLKARLEIAEKTNDDLIARIANAA